MPEHIVETINGYLDAGGFVMPPLVLGAMVLWYAIGHRALTLQRGTTMSVRPLVEASRRGLRGRPRGIIDRAAQQGVSAVRRCPDHLSDALNESFFGLYQEVKKGRVVIQGIVTIAPLIGLLGTVTGMIETFDSLGDMSLFAQSGGIAGGISQALFSTQLGLCIAVPVVIVGRLLDRRQRRIEEELDQLKALLGGAA